MATALSPRRYTHALQTIAKPSSPEPPAPNRKTLSAQLWEASQDLAQAALASDYIQGIKYGTLQPNDYGQYSVQDAAYCHHGLEDWQTVAARATHPAIQAFAEARVQSWQAYTQSTYSDWHIQDPNAVQLSSAAQTYADFESNVAQNYDPIYAVVVMTPCDRLWYWLAKQLRPHALDTNLYKFWITENLDEAGAKRLEAVIDGNEALLDEAEALEVYRTAMLGEVNFFRSAGHQDPFDPSSETPG